MARSAPIARPATSLPSQTVSGDQPSGGRLHHVAQVDDPAGVGPRRRPPACRGSARGADVGGGERVGEVVLELGDLADLDARRQAQLERVMRGPATVPITRASTPKCRAPRRAGRRLLLARRVGLVGIAAERVRKLGSGTRQTKAGTSVTERRRPWGVRSERPSTSVSPPSRPARRLGDRLGGPSSSSFEGGSGSGCLLGDLVEISVGAPRSASAQPPSVGAGAIGVAETSAVPLRSVRVTAVRARRPRARAARSACAGAGRRPHRPV